MYRNIIMQILQLLPWCFGFRALRILNADFNF